MAKRPDTTHTQPFQHSEETLAVAPPNIIKHSHDERRCPSSATKTAQKLRLNMPKHMMFGVDHSLAMSSTGTIVGAVPTYANI